MPRSASRVVPRSPKPPSQARRYADLTEEIEDFRRSLGEALEQRTATGAILHAISRSPKDLPAVLDAVVSNAARLSHSANVSLYQVDGDRMRKVAEHEDGPQLTTLRVGETRPITRTSVSGRAIIDRTMIHVRDHRSAEVAREFPDGARRDTGIYTTLGFPLLADGRALGAFTVYRTEHRPFTESEIALLQSFADQAVIAIENVRLFTNLETRNTELRVALEQQTATSEILHVISRSLTDIQPVLDAVAESAARLCESLDSAVYRRDGDRLVLVAHHGLITPGLVGEFSVPVIRQTVNGRAVLDGRTVHVADMQASAAEFPVGSLLARGERLHWEDGQAYAGATMPARTLLSVPLMRKGIAIGTINLRRTEAQLFSDRQVALLETFADQAVIAIENVRLFKELEARNRDLTATGELLRDIRLASAPVAEVVHN